MTTAAKVEKVKQLIASGVPQGEALKQVKLSQSGYRYHTVLRNQPKKKPNGYHAIPIPETGTFEFKGTPEQVARFLAAMAKEFRNA